MKMEWNYSLFLYLLATFCIGAMITCCGNLICFHHRYHQEEDKIKKIVRETLSQLTSSVTIETPTTQTNPSHTISANQLLGSETQI